MTTNKQIEANQRNALLSSGPRSLAGKARSRQNALKHGLTASQTMLPGEDPAEFAGLRESMFNSLKPLTDLEFQLVERIASLVWRLRRVQAFEVALMKWMAYCQAATYDAPIDAADLATVERRNESDDDIDDLQDSLRAGRAFEALLSSDLTTKMTLYESRMQSQLSGVIKDLSELKLARAKRSQLARTLPKKPYAAEPTYDEYLPYKGKWLKKIGPP
jgi:hypothetical protein